MLRTFTLLVLACALAAGMHFALAEFVEDWAVRLINLCGIAIVMAASLNVINGLTGQFSLGHAGFMAVGAYISAAMTTPLRTLDVETGMWVDHAALLQGSLWFVPSLVAGGVAAAVAGLAVGIPTLRLKGDYLAIATLGFGEIVRVLLTSFELLGGARGLSRVPPHANTFYIFAAAAACIVFSINLQRSTFGRALIAVRENELAAETMGVRVTRMKIMAFVYGAFFAGISGGLFAHLSQFIDPKTFDLEKSIQPVVMIVLGGLGSLTGAVVGAVTMTLLPELLRPLEENLGLPGIRMVVYAATLIVFMLFRPAGIFGQEELGRRNSWKIAAWAAALAAVSALLWLLTLAIGGKS